MEHLHVLGPWPISDSLNQIMRHILAAWLLAALLFGVGQARAGDASAGVNALIERIAPGHAKDFVLETIAGPGKDNVFEVERRGEKIVLRGDSPLSQAVAFNWYLKHCALVDVSWYADDAVTLPGQLPMPIQKIRETTKIKDRFFLNYCTFGYTMAYWHWRDWERLIDWMALNGVNLPLAQNGNEYIWQKVWHSYGLTDDEIRSYFTGPAYLPWHRMVNIDKWGGPLPQDFIDGQHDLQKKILARERELGMKPVLCAFAGHVPEALKVKHSEMQIEEISPGWSGFSKEYACWFLSPLDPKFREIQTRFLHEQQKEYGTSHYYGTDPFNEISPPSWEPSYLAGVSRAIYDGMTAVDSEAVWLQMSWTFGRDRQHWTDERLSAMIKAVPPGRMELIDYFCENNELFRNTRAFYGAPFIWAYLGNFGGNSFLAGPVNRINRNLSAAFNDATLTNFIGVGATLEGLNNPVLYELIFDRAWTGTNLDLAQWTSDEACARAGCADTNVMAAWGVLRQKVLLDGDTSFHGHGCVFQATHPSLSGEIKGRLSPKIEYDNRDLLVAWRLLLQACPEARKSSAYQRDLVDVTRQALGNFGLDLRQRMAESFARRDAVAFKKAADQFMDVGRDLDGFLGTRSEFLLGKWIADARSWARTSGEADYYEKDARRLITVWGGNLIDYAGRQQNGLLGDYYLPRWQMLIEAAETALEGGKVMDEKTLETRWRQHDLSFATAAGGNYAAQPEGDFYTMSSRLFKKYSLLATDPKLASLNE